MAKGGNPGTDATEDRQPLAQRQNGCEKFTIREFVAIALMC
jgi:hypothetical protein